MKKTNALFFAGSLVGFLIGYVLSNSVSFGLCLTDQYDCRDLFNAIGDPLFYGAGALAIIFVALLFVPQAFKAWKKFAIWFVPLAALLFIFYPDPSGGDLFSPRQLTVYKWVSGAYVLISAAIILFNSRKPK